MKVKWLLRWLRPRVEGDAEPQQTEETVEPAPADDAAPAEAPEEAEEPADLVRELLAREPKQPAEPAPSASIPEPQRIESVPQPTRDAERDAEDAQLERARQSGMSENDLAWMRWQIAQNRETREAKRMSERALSESRDAADRADFGRLEFTDPDLYRAYAPRIEKIIADTRAKGQTTAPRGAILRLLLGDDLLNRKQAKRTPKSEARAPAPTSTVARTPAPRARSDVQARAGGNEREDRRRRLEGKSI